MLAGLEPEQATYAGLVRSLRDVPADRPAVITNETSVSYGELSGRIGATASYLLDLGIVAGDHVAVMMANSIDALVVQLAVQTAGAVGVLVHSSLSGEALRHVLAHSDAVVGLVDADLADEVGRAAPQFPVHAAADVDLASALAGGVDPTELLDRLRPSPYGAAFVNYTSGTTGTPKGVVLPQLFSMAAMLLARRLGLRPDEERVYLCTPLYHALGLANSAMTLRLRGQIVLPPRFSARRYWDDIRNHRCTFAYHVGTIARMLFNQPPQPTDGEHELRTFMGGGMPADIWEQFAARFRVTVFEAYSASDGVGSIANFGDAPVGSIGRPGPELETRLVDEAGNDVAVGEVGELWLRPAGAPALVEYYKDPAATDEKTRDGWLHTGDLMRRDDSGALFFVDRAKDIVRRRGVNIAPAEVERILCGHPAITECTVHPVPSDLGEDELKLVVPRAAGLGEPELAAHCDAVLPVHMRPRYVELVDELPKTDTERVQRFKLKQSWRTPTTWDTLAAGYLGTIG